MAETVEAVLVDIATGKQGTISQRLAAAGQLRRLYRQQAADELRKQKLALEEEKARIRRKEADNVKAVIELDKIRSKLALLAEQRKKRAHDRQESRALNHALKGIE